jgi:hypothetical protein
VRVGFSKLLVILGLAMLQAQAAIGAVTFEPERNLSDSETTSAIPEISPQPLAFDKSGRVVVVWSEFATPESPPELAVRVSDAQGKFVEPASPLTTPDGKYSGDACVAGAADGTVHVAWADQSTGFALWVGTIHPETGALVNPKALPGSGAQLIMDPAIAAGPGGEVAVVWTSMDDMNYEVKLARFAPKGGWGAVSAVSPADRKASDQPAAAFDANGRLHIAWADNRAGVRRILYALSDGSKIGAPVLVDTLSAAVKQTRPQVAVDSGGQVLLAWQDARAGKEIEQVYLARKAKSGAFGPVLPATRGAGATRSAALAIASGVVYLAWEDVRALSMAETPSVQIYFAARPETALKPGEEKPITADRPVSCTNPAMALDRQGNVHLIWRNSEQGAGDIFYRRGVASGS